MTHFFEYVRADDGVPPAERDRVDVAILDMNHSWPNVGHDSLVRAGSANAALDNRLVDGIGLGGLLGHEAHPDKQSLDRSKHKGSFN